MTRTTIMYSRKVLLLMILALTFFQCSSDSTKEQEQEEEQVLPLVATGKTPEQEKKLSTLEESGESTEATSLLARRSSINQEEIMNKLIREGAYLKVESEVSLHVNEVQVELPDPSLNKPKAYRDLSIFKYLEDLQWFSYYKQEGISLQNMVPLPAQEQYQGLLHKELNYPLSRSCYWMILDGESSVFNPAYRSLPQHSSSSANNCPKNKLNNDPYQALIELYKLGLHPMCVSNLEEEVDSSFYLFHERPPNSYQAEYTTNELLASAVYQQAKSLIEAKNGAQKQPVNNYELEQLSPGQVAAIQEELLQSKLPDNVLEYLQQAYNNANKSADDYAAMNTKLEALLKRMQAYSFSETEQRYIEGIQESITHLYESWRILADQLQELIQLPAAEKNFSLIPLIEFSETERTAKLSSIPKGTIDVSLFTELRNLYLRQVREVETAFRQQ